MAKSFKPKTDLLARAKQQHASSEDTIRERIKILPELKALIRPLSEVELNQLEENIKKEGCKVPITLWERKPGEYVIVDGHNRFAVCSKNDIKFPFKVQSFEDMGEVKEFMINEQLGRRNLTKREMDFYIGMKYESEKQTGFKSKEESGHTALRIAEEHNTSVRSVERNASYARGMNLLEPELRNKVLDGKFKVKKGDIEWVGDKMEGAGQDSISESQLEDYLVERGTRQKAKAKAAPKKEPSPSEEESETSDDRFQILEMDPDDLPSSDLEEIIEELRKAVKKKDQALYNKSMLSLEHLKEMIFDL